MATFCDESSPIMIGTAQDQHCGKSPVMRPFYQGAVFRLASMMLQRWKTACTAWVAPPDWESLRRACEMSRANEFLGISRCFAPLRIVAMRPTN